MDNTETLLNKILHQNEYIVNLILLTRNLVKVVANKGTLHEVGGFAYGRTSDGDAFVLLYPSHPKMIQKVCRVYPQDFDKLPYHVPTASIPKVATSDNPTKTQLKKTNLYHNCPTFTIATTEGKETQMGPEIRFFDTIELTRNADDQLRQQAPPPIAKPDPAPTQEIPPPPINTTSTLPNTPEAVADALGLGAENTTTTLLTYGDNSPVPDNPGTKRIFDAYVKKYESIPPDRATLIAFHENPNKE